MSVPAPTTIAYGPHPDQIYDRWDPDGRTEAAGLTVAFVHGGFWRAEYDRTHAVPAALAFARAGFQVALLEYRRVGTHGGGFPGTARDVVAGLTALCADPTLAPVVAVGHSAGGHLVAWAASADRVPRLRGAVTLAGVVDLAAGDRLALGDWAIRDFLGGSPAQEPQAWADADPARHRLTTPMTVLCGALDSDVPPQVSREYVGNRGPGQAPCRLVEVANAGHFELIDPGHPAFAEVIRAVSAFRGYC